jgi:hypothetical protein
MDIWQRGTSITSINSYSADRWIAGLYASASTVTRQATGDTTNLPFIQYCLRYQRNAGATATNSMIIVQSLETVNSIPLAGKTVTLSFYGRRGANFSPATLAVSLQSGTGTDQNLLTAGYTGNALPIDASATLTTTWQRFSYTGTVASTATELGVQFSATPSGTAGAADFYEVTGVQLEVGSVATQFTRQGGTIQGELAACRRYLPVYNPGLTLWGYSNVVNFATYGVVFDTPARVAPSGITVSGTFNAYNGNTATSVTPIFDTSSVNGANVYAGFTISLNQPSRLFLASGSLLLFTGCEL